MFNLDSFAAENIIFIRRYAEAFGLSQHDAEDVASTVILDFIKKYQQGRVNVTDNPKAYLSVLARWRITDCARRNIKSAATFNTIGEDNDLDSLMSEEERPKNYKKILKTALNTVYKNKKARKDKCSDRDCEIFKLAVFDEKPAQEIADLFKTTKPTVYLARHRVGKQIKKLIQTEKWNLNSLS